MSRAGKTISKKQNKEKYFSVNIALHANVLLRFYQILSDLCKHLIVETDNSIMQKKTQVKHKSFDVYQDNY